MTEPVSRQRRLAAHYVAAGDSERLRSTAALVADSLGFPVAQINILDDRRVYSVGAHGMEFDEAPRGESMCQFVLEDGHLVVTNDPGHDERFKQLQAVRDGVVGTYVGVPLQGREEAQIGTLCVIDSEHRDDADTVVERLQEFARLVENQLEVLRRGHEQRRTGRSDVADVAGALRRREILPWYQPIVELASGRVTALEALARWEQPGRGDEPVVPNVLRAEDSDLIVDLDRAVLQQAVADFARWQEQRADLRLNLNLSTRHLELSDTADVVQYSVAAAGVDPRRVTLEITETRELTDLQRAATAVGNLRQLGFGVALDDFGKGWSSLDWLLGLDVDGIKVDGLVAETLDTRVGAATCRAVIGIAAEMRMSTTLEGIGEPWQHDLAVAAGFEFGQGYLWSPAVPAARVDLGA